VVVIDGRDVEVVDSWVDDNSWGVDEVGGCVVMVDDIGL